MDQLQVALEIEDYQIFSINGGEYVSNIEHPFARTSSDLLRIIYVMY